MIKNTTMIDILPNFEVAIKQVRDKLTKYGYTVRTEKWQGIPLEHDMWETLNTSFSCFINPDLEIVKQEVKPNLPWADIHFDERVSGQPLNPGQSYKLWPFYKMDNKMRTEGEKFTHTYMERIWPKMAGTVLGVRYDKELGFNNSKKEFFYTDQPKDHTHPPLLGIRYTYGDLNDLVRLLYGEPFTRQAFLPIWFPEDTGANHGGRIPCTIGYHFIRREQFLHVVYYIRSCDYRRHFRDDIYLAVRKVMWLLDKLKSLDENNNESKWDNVKPGIFTMHITSLHCFHNELWAVKKEK